MHFPHFHIACLVLADKASVSGAIRGAACSAGEQRGLYIGAQCTAAHPAHFQHQQAQKPRKRVQRSTPANCGALYLSKRWSGGFDKTYDPDLQLCACLFVNTCVCVCVTACVCVCACVWANMCVCVSLCLCLLRRIPLLDVALYKHK